MYFIGNFVDDIESIVLELVFYVDCYVCGCKFVKFGFEESGVFIYKCFVIYKNWYGVGGLIKFLYLRVFLYGLVVEEVLLVWGGLCWVLWRFWEWSFEVIYCFDVFRIVDIIFVWVIVDNFVYILSEKCWIKFVLCFCWLYIMFCM